MTSSIYLLSLVLASPPEFVPIPSEPVVPTPPMFPSVTHPIGPRREVLLPDPSPRLPVLPPVPVVRGAIPDLPPVPARPARTPTLQQFAREFNPTAGVHDVTILHPVSGKPIDVTFKLPPGQPKVWLYNRSIVFQYPRDEVQILFRILGRADVRYD